MIDRLASAVILLCSTSSVCPKVFGHPLHAQVLVRAVSDAANQHRVSTDELLALAWEESRFNPRAVSRRGARGILQVLWRYWPYIPCQGATYKCLRRQASAGAQAYAHFRRKCRTLPRAIRAYRSGRCGPPTHGTRLVLRALRHIRRRA